MATSTQTSVRREIDIAVPIERAFAVFTEQFDRIKPREHNMLAVPIAETVFETRVGGSVYDRGEDGSVCRWARVLAFEPPHRFVISWDITPPMASRDKPRPVQRGRGTFRCPRAGPDPGRAGAPPSEPPR